MYLPFYILYSSCTKKQKQKTTCFKSRRQTSKFHVLQYKVFPAHPRTSKMTKQRIIKEFLHEATKICSYVSAHWEKILHSTNKLNHLNYQIRENYTLVREKSGNFVIWLLWQPWTWCDVMHCNDIPFYKHDVLMHLSRQSKWQNVSIYI